MLGLRSAPKEDCGLSSAEMVYGEALTLPGECLEASTPPGDSFLQLLRERMSLWGLRNITKIWVYDIITMGLIYPLSEHVDNFPVRLVPTFH